MSYTKYDSADAPPSGLGASLASNNPFRNRAVSPREAPPRPTSRNPFLDDAVFDNNGMNTKENARPQQNARKSSPPTNGANAALMGNAATLFDELTMEDNSRQAQRPTPANRSYTDHNRKENLIPRGAPPIHRPSRSQEQTNGARRAPPPPSGNSISRPRQQDLDIFADDTPQMKSPERRVRRNSDSSIMDKKTIDDEKRRQERRRRERKEREAQDLKDGKLPKKATRKLDLIDQLDATSIYGTGLFHHDGPFDACNPHRNKKGARRAPMQAFPKDSLNNSLRGGPNNAKADHSAFLGNNNVEAFKDYSSKAGVNGQTYEPYGPKGLPSKGLANVESAVSKVEPVHGDLTMGLGTSTFLDGAPASRAAVAKAQQEEAEQKERMTPGAGAGGLGRKKSIAQKIRGISTNRREFSNGPQYRSAEARYSPTTPKYTPNGGKAGTELNPFFNEFGEPINGGAARQDMSNGGEGRSHQRAPSSPTGYQQHQPDLERRVTTDSAGFLDGGEGAVEKKSGGGFLSRVKSLKGGGRRPKAEKPLYE